MNGYDWIYDVVRRIPRGRVATYGQIADLAGISGQPRRVGYALSALPEDSAVPWHRVVNSKGAISTRSNRSVERLQRRLLEREGVVFGRDAKVSLERYQWKTKF